MNAPRIKIMILGAFLFVGIFAFAGISHAATKTWTGSGNWNTSANWTPSGVPGATTDVIFSASSTSNCTINTTAAVKSITITSGYTGIITEGSGEAVGTTGNFSQAGGTFTGSSNTSDQIGFAGTFSLTGGTFTATKGLLGFGASTTFAGGAFNNNSGTTEFTNFASGTPSIITGSSTFYNLQFGQFFTLQNSVFIIATGTVLTAQGNLWVADNSDSNDILGGEIDIQGNIEAHNSPIIPMAGSTSFVLTGTGTQVLGALDGVLATDCDLNFQDCSYYYLPNLTINKPSGQVTFTGAAISLFGNWTNLDGPSVMVAGTSTILFAGGTSPIITGSTTFNSLYFGTNNDFGDLNLTVATGTIVSVQGGITYAVDDNMVYLSGGGEIDDQGDVSMGNSTLSQMEQASISIGNPTSTFNLVLDGTSTQTLSNEFNSHNVGLGNLNQFEYPLFLPSVTINKASGQVAVRSNIAITGNWTNLDGPSAISNSTGTIQFIGASTTISGSSTFYSVHFGEVDDQKNDYYDTITTGTVITATGDTIFDPDFIVQPYLLGGGEYDAQGDISLSNVPPAPAIDDSYFKFVVNGTGTQLIYDNGHSNPSNGNPFWFPSITVNKPSGVAYLSANWAGTIGSLSVLSGELQIAASSSASGLFEVDGTTSVSAGAILSDYPDGTSTVSFGDNITNNGLVSFSGDGYGCTAPIPANITIESGDGLQKTWSGSGTYVMRYLHAGNQAKSGSPNITVWNGVDDGGNTNWTFNAGLPRIELVQSVASNGGSGTSQLSLALPFEPRQNDLILVAVSARNQSISAPTDSVGNTYTLVASTTWGSSPTYSLALYYAQGIQNAANSSTFTINASGTNSLGSQFLSASAFDYEGVTATSTFDTFSINTPGSSATAITSLSAAGTSFEELYFGASTISASTTAATGSGWTSESGVSNNNTRQALLVEDQASTTLLTTAATWTAATSTNFGAIMGIFRAPFASGYPASGTLDSATFDTGITGGAQLNSIIWQGSSTNNTSVKFQLAVSNSSSGPWTFIGPSGDGTTYFSGSAGTSIPLASTGGGYNIFSGYRYFRYRAVLFSDPSFTYTPTVSQVVVNWSP